MKKKFLTMTLLGLCAIGVRAADPALSLSGAGTEANPYLIQSMSDLQELENACNNPTSSQRGNFAGKYFKLMIDLDFKDRTDFLGIATSKPDQSAASTSSYYFAGVFDGNNHVVKNMKIDGLKFVESTGLFNTSTGANGSRNYVGFFGILSTDAVVKNLTIDASCKITGYNYVGGICGYATKNSTIENCKNYADVWAGTSYVGGICGDLYGSSSAPAGSIINCVNYGNIECNGNSAAGICGYSYYGKEISKCTNFGNVFGGNNVLKPSQVSHSSIGGVVGSLQYTQASDLVNYGVVTGESYNGTTFTYQGALIGYGYQSASVAGSLTNCFGFGSMISNAGYIGMIVGQNGSAETSAIKITNAIYDGQLNAVTGGFSMGLDTNNGIKGMTTAELTSGTPIPGFDTDYWAFEKGYYPYPKALATDAKPICAVYATLPNGVNADDFTGTATINTGVTGKMITPNSIFTVNGSTITAGKATTLSTDTLLLTSGNYNKYVYLRQMPILWDGAGTQASPYLIKTKKDIESLANMVNGDAAMHYDGVYFQMTNDIDMENDETFHGIGAKMGTSSSFNVYYFSGNFDGKGYTIKNLKIKNTVFNASTGNAETVANGSSAVAGFFGTLSTNAVVQNLNFDASCYVDGYSYVGMVCGYMLDNAKITNCTNAGEVWLYNSQGAGGIAGYCSGADIEISNCVNSGSIYGNNNSVAGIAGYGKGTIKSCVNTGRIKAYWFNGTNGTTTKRYVGGICGYAYGLVEDCANYGVIENVAGYIGGITGDIAGASTGTGDIRTSFTSGQVITTNNQNTGSVIGLDGGTATYVTNIQNVFVDGQVNVYLPLRNEDNDSITSLTTAEFTSGEKIEGLGSNWTFEKGYYPMPTAVAQNAAVRAAACTFITQPEGSVTSFGSAVINNVQPLTAKLTNDKVFKIEGLNVTAPASEEIVQDTLTLTNGSFLAIYPLQKLPAVLPGGGTVENPYQIKSPADFKTIADYMLESNWMFINEHFALMNDIDFSKDTLTQIGHAKLPFGGHLDGKNFAIKNLKVDYDDKNFNNNNALFNTLAPQGLIENITLSNVKIYNYSHAAGICITSSGTIRNITVDDQCEFAVKYHGPLLGQEGSYASAICNVALSGAVFDNIVNKANLTAAKYVGSVVSYITTGNPISITNCENYGDITCTGDYVATGTSSSKKTDDHYGAGIAGSVQGTLKNCVNYGNVTSLKGNYMGGIAGKMWTNTTLDSVVNYGNVAVADTAGGQYGGGIVGATQTTINNAVITNAVNYGRVTGNSNLGGITGLMYNVDGRIAHAYNYGDISAINSYAAGIAGYISGSNAGNLLIDTCYNVGMINGVMNIAGISGGGFMLATLNHCYNGGIIIGMPSGSTNPTSVAGIANGYIKATDVYNSGNVTGYSSVAGIVGGPEGSSSVKNAYNVGNINATCDFSKLPVAVGSIFGEIATGMTAENVYGLMNANMKQDVNVEYGVVMKDMNGLTEIAKDLGSAFVGNDYCLPMLTELDTLACAKINAAYFLLPALNANGEVDTEIMLSQLPDVVWSANALLQISDNVAKPMADGTAELTATCGKYSKKYTIKVAKYNGVDIITSIDEVVEAKYFTMDGRQVTEPVEHGVTICVYKLASGKTMTKKMIKK